MDAYGTLNDILVNLFNEIMDLEQNALITDKFTNISNNDMHILEAIGDKEPQKMTHIARKMKVTVGTLTSAMNNLVKKGYVIRNKSQEDRRVVFISLSELGFEAFSRHVKFHDDMVVSIIQELDENEIIVLVKALKKLNLFFKNYS